MEGVRDGVKIRVIVEPGGEGIITGFPSPYPVHGGDDGLARWHFHNAPHRDWSTSMPHALYPQVEDDEG